ncbi:protoporphyrinogen/coproporphyrinogen oxidase [Deinococcus aestuarii]|uniref:protoporphyrinogen/coproporphyrinogen oxidase n=1 Tax=Deinococcus aestuarii TaxID=2774531 RepID=UPI001C0AE2BC|nr:FAD-dependent oxidoreductase [Deinococcus aestuarii]
MIVILGAGPAGLSAAYHLEREYVVLEKNETPGGLCRSFELGGLTFDLGGHAFFTRHEPVRELLWNLLDGAVYTQPRSAWVHSHGAVVPYPFQANLHGLPHEIVHDCLLGLHEAARQGEPGEATNLLSWIGATFGSGIARHFMVPYNEKVWAHPLDDIYPEWTGQRIVRPDFAEVLDGALRRRDFTSFDNAQVSYPLRGGFEGFFTPLVEAVRPNLRHEAALELDLEARRVHTDQGRTYEYEGLVSTIPLTALVRSTRQVPPKVQEAADRLRHNSLHLVNLVFGRPAMTEMQRLYSADPRDPFHKLVFNANSTPRPGGAPGFSVQAEVSFSAHKPVDREGLFERVLDSLTRMNVIGAGERPTASSVVTLPLAYPVYDHAWADARRTILDHYAAHDVHCVGRFGEWLYINSDGAVHRAMNVARRLSENPVSTGFQA